MHLWVGDPRGCEVDLLSILLTITSLISLRRPVVSALEIVQIFLVELAVNQMRRISLSSKSVRKILIIYFRLIYQIVKTDINVSAAQPTQGRMAEKISGTLSASGNVHSVFCQIAAYNFQLRLHGHCPSQQGKEKGGNIRIRISLKTSRGTYRSASDF